MDKDFSPAEAIEAVRRHRGSPPGPPPDVVLPNDHLAPARVGDESGGGTRPAAPGVANVSLATGLGLDGKTVLGVEGAEDQGDGVSLSRREGYFEGHVLILNDEEVRRLRGFFAEVVQRQLSEEYKKFKGYRIKGKEAI